MSAFTSLFRGLLVFSGLTAIFFPSTAQEARLLRQPSLSAEHIAFIYAADLWIADKAGGEASRLTSTAAVEGDPHFSPDGKQIAFTSNRSGTNAVYVLPISGGTPKRLTWYPAASLARGWTPDGKEVLYASSRETAPTAYNRLWTVPVTGGPSKLLPAPWANDGSFAQDGKRIVIDPMSRWDVEWRAYRGGQNTPLTILSLDKLEEVKIPNSERSTDIQPIWMGNTIYFLSDRDWTMNVWAYSPANGALRQVSKFSGSDIKWLGGFQNTLIFERDGYLYTMDPASGAAKQLSIQLSGDFPWAETRWENVTGRASAAALSPTGKRVAFEARGEIFTVPVENGDPRNLTRSSGAADRTPAWSPDGTRIAWFSDAGGEGYGLMISHQDGMASPRRIPIGESKMAWEPVWSPDSKYLAFVDDDVRVRVVNVEAGTIRTADTGGTNIERGSMDLSWSPDSRWLSYAKTAPNQFRRVTVWSPETGKAQAISGPLADAFSPAWDRNGLYLYFLASTDVALGAGWANTSAMQANPSYGAYIAVLDKDSPTPFPLKSDEEPDTARVKKETAPADKTSNGSSGVASIPVVGIDIEGIESRTLALPVPLRNYVSLISGPKGSVFMAESNRNAPGLTLHKFTLETRKAEEFASGVQQAAVSANGEKILLQSMGKWRVVSTAKNPGPAEGMLNFTLRTELDRLAEWKQMFTEAWRYERDYFYDPSLHGRDWQNVWDRYAPLLPHIRHRNDLSYLLDQINGELSVGHSFVFGGDFPAVDTVRVGLPGADLVAENGAWRIKRIFTAESWNPGLVAPLDQPGLKVAEGDYLVGIEGRPILAADDPYRFFDGTAGKQTILHLNKRPGMDSAWTIVVQPVASESALRQRAWVEDNRRRVDELSGGRLAYVWVPNTSSPGFVSFNRYYFAQQDKAGAVIDERFNGGGLLDDYMVDLMTRRLRAALTNEVPEGQPMRLPAGILGPKVLLINELAGSGGDFFPWVFRQQKAGPLIGARTWGGLVKSSVHYALVDGGALTAPDNAVFDPINKKWIAENEGVAPDIEVRLDAASTARGRDPQLERAVQEALKLLEQEPTPKVAPPPFSKPAAKDN
ncbi:MAG: S41 family peptidase [Saprospiraceae bacterium]